MDKPDGSADACTRPPAADWMRHDLVGSCWWCGKAAKSGEHKFKRSDLHRAFGREAWGRDNQVVHLSDQGQGNVNSSNASRLKFAAVLCADCNSARSQPFDLSYERFADYIVAHDDQILSEGFFDWGNIFRADWRSGQLNVAKYWVKHIGCRLAQEGVPVHPDLPAFLDGHGPLRRLSMLLSIQADIAAVSRHERDVHGGDFGESMWMGPAVCDYSESRKHIFRVRSHWGLNWLRLSYAYNYDADGAETNFSAQRVSLPPEHMDPPFSPSMCLTCAE